MHKEFTDRFLPCICGRNAMYRKRKSGDWIATCSNLACDKLETIIRDDKVEALTVWNEQVIQGGAK